MLRVRSCPNPQCMQVEQLNVEICRHYVCPRLSRQARRLVVVVQKSGLAIVLRLAARAVGRPAGRRAAVTAACRPARSIKRKKMRVLEPAVGSPRLSRLLSPSRARLLASRRGGLGRLHHQFLSHWPHRTVPARDWRVEPARQPAGLITVPKCCLP